MKTAVLLGLISTVMALPSPSPQAAAAPAAADPNACAAVSKAFVQQKAANPQTPARVPASTAIACLQSVPNKPGPAIKLVNSIRAYSQWESTLTYLKNPPAGYGLPAVDIMGGFDAIMANVTAGAFRSEYEFQVSISKLIAGAHDGHYGFRPDVYKAFSFRNDLANDLVSVSVDGIQTPKLYNLGLLNGTKTTVGNISVPIDANGFPPAVTKINGVDAATFMTNSGLEFINTQDQDAQWNIMMQSYAQPAALAVVAGSIIYQGDSVTLEYANGQTITQDSYAIIRSAANFSGITSGEDYYNKFCNPDTAPVKPTAGATPATPTAPDPVPGTLQPPAPAIPGFPTPAIRDSGANATAGYFLTGAGYEDTAVLSVLGFAPLGDPAFSVIEYITNFQTLVQDFLAMCKAANKTKLVIDVSANGGGLVVAGYELYSQIFPGNPIFQANNLRRTESLVQMAEIADANLPKLLALTNADLGSNATQETQALVAIAQSAVVSNLLPGGVNSAGDKTVYNTTAEILAPVMLAGDTFTAYQSTPQNQPSSDFNLTGVGSRANPAPAVFAPENVVILTDGSCGSTCTLFSYLMIMQNNIKTVAVGGRPQTGPMQSMGGVEGAQVFELEDLNEAAAAALILATPEQRAQLNGSDLALIAEGYALDRAAQAGSAGAINGKNAFSHVDTTTPLQFLNQPANCRFFYTKDMIYGPMATWKRAADAAFNNPDQFCVQGSQQPLMGVQAPSNAFFTGAGAGQTVVLTAGAPKHLVAGGVVMGCAVAFVSVVLLV